jgi:transcriptional regulator with XRE-family HTH domain
VISRWESGSLEPTIFDLEALGRQLRVKVDDLLLESDIVEGRRRWSSRSHSPADRRALGAAICAARMTAGLTVLDVYRQTSIGGLRLLRVEAGADPSLLELVKLCRLIGVSPDFLLRQSRQRTISAGRVMHRTSHASER